jgi:hypothetical protein
MESETEAKILRLLDVISLEVAATRNELRDEFRGEISGLRNEFSGLRTEMRTGFNRVERRLGNLETRVEGVETDLRSFRAEFERRITPLEH